MIELDQALQEKHLEIRRNNLAKASAEIMLGVYPSTPFPLILPALIRSASEVVWSEERELKYVSNHLVSEAAAQTLLTHFPWKEIKGFSHEKILSAARELRYTIYDKNNPSPYSNIQLFPNTAFILVDFGDQSQKSSPGELQSRQPMLSIIKKFFVGEPQRASNFTALHFPNIEGAIPQVVIDLAEGKVQKLRIASIGQHKSNGSSEEMVNALVQKLGYKVTQLELSEPLQFVPLEKIQPDEEKRKKLLEQSALKKSGGIYYLESETPHILE